MIVSNSSPIISLGKRGYLFLLKKCFNKVIIPEEVYKEIIIKINSVEANALKKAIKERWLHVEKVEIIDFLKNVNIENGEKEAISLAYKYKNRVLLDDDSAKSFALMLNLDAHGTLFVIHFAYLMKYITKDQAKEVIDLMIKDGFYISTDVYSIFINLLEQNSKS